MRVGAQRRLFRKCPGQFLPPTNSACGPPVQQAALHQPRTWSSASRRVFFLRGAPGGSVRLGDRMPWFKGVLGSTLLQSSCREAGSTRSGARRSSGGAGMCGHARGPRAGEPRNQARPAPVPGPAPGPGLLGASGFAPPSPGYGSAWMRGQGGMGEHAPSRPPAAPPSGSNRRLLYSLGPRRLGWERPRRAGGRQRAWPGAWPEGCPPQERGSSSLPSSRQPPPRTGPNSGAVNSGSASPSR